MLKLRNVIVSFLFVIAFAVQSQSYLQMESNIDRIVSEAIGAKAFPGCVVYASKADSVFFFKSYGHHTYDSIRSVQLDHLYDLASITKVVGGTLAVMKLYEDGYIQLDDPIGHYIDRLGKKIGQATFREVLAHQAGLYPWIPYYSESKRKNGTFKKQTVTNVSDEQYPFSLSDSLYLHHDFYRIIKKMIRKSAVAEEKEYTYSGLFFYLIPELVYKLTDTPYPEYLAKQFYNPLGAKTLTFNPLDKFSKEQIAPTEIDTFFRMEPIHGRVHDEGAIMMKGVSANAGLFSNAVDLAKVFNMLLNGGSLDTVQLLSPHTIQLFTTTQYPDNDNRRALGFDKPLLKYDSIKSSVAESASHRSYGHTGYTGTLAWADPDQDLVFIFLTNRVYPSRTNRAIYELNVRPTIHQVIYNYLESLERKED